MCATVVRCIPNFDAMMGSERPDFFMWTIQAFLVGEVYAVMIGDTSRRPGSKCRWYAGTGKSESL